VLDDKENKKVETMTLPNGKKLTVAKVKNGTWYHLTVIDIDGTKEIDRMYGDGPTAAKELHQVIAALVSRNQ
jgi:hypothetical protein